MDIYEKYILKQVNAYDSQVYKENEWLGWTKNIQQKLDRIIPKKVHQSLAAALEKGIKTFLQGVHLLSKQSDITEGHTDSIHALSEEAEKIVQKYKRMASLEGAGTGLGGIIASTIDFPALISIKLKMLQEIALLFGKPIHNFEERLFILKVLQLQFSGKAVKQRIWQEIKEWELQQDLNEWDSWEEFNWEEFYMEYKQSIELVKLLQIIPGLGAIVGAWANYSFLDDLGKTAILTYQLRYLSEKYGQIF